MTAEVTYPEGQWPEVVIIMTTWAGPPEKNISHLRFEYTVKTVASLRQYVHYPNLSWHIADDGSPAEYQERVKALLGKDKFTFTDTKRGWDISNNWNTAIKVVLRRADIFFLWPDDRFLNRDVDLKQYVSLLMSYNDIGAVRFTPQNPGLIGTPIQRCRSTWWICEKKSPIGTIINFSPNLYHRRYWDTYGFLKTEIWPPDFEEAAMNVSFRAMVGPELIVHNDFWKTTEMSWGGESNWEIKNVGGPYRKFAPWQENPSLLGVKPDFRRRDTCRVCRGSKLTPFLDFGNMPLAGGFLMPEQFAEEKTYPLEIAICEDCSLVQNLVVVDPDILFRHYLYLSSTTETVKAHFDKLATFLHECILPQGKPLVVEIGCNDGVLLRPLQQMGIRAIGVDPARNVAEIAQKEGFQVIPEYFTESVAHRIVMSNGQADVIIASNCFAHIDDIDEVMYGVCTLLAPDGFFIVEVGYVADLIEHTQYDLFYHEHLSYFSVHSLNAFFKRYGFEVVRAGRMPLHEGTLRVFARRIGQEIAHIDGILAREDKCGLAMPETYIQYRQHVLQHREKLCLFVVNNHTAGRSLCGYGAASRATILLNYCGIDTKYMRHIIDSTPLRAGKYMPGVHIPIYLTPYFREHPTDDCMITAWTYEKEIMGKEADYKGRFIIPLPTIRMLRS